MGEMKEVVRGWRNPSTRERQADGGVPGGSLAGPIERLLAG